MVGVVITNTAFSAHAAQPADATRKDLFRVELPLPKTDYQNAHLSLQNLIGAETFVDVSQFHLYAVEVVATTATQGAVRLQVGRFITPPASAAARSPNRSDNIPADSIEPLFIPAPHKSKQDWQLVLEDQVAIHQLTAILEPQASALAVLNTQRPAALDPALNRDDVYRTDRFGRTPFDRRRSGAFYRDRLDPFDRGFRNRRSDVWRSRRIDIIARDTRLRRSQERAQRLAQLQAEARARAIERARELRQDADRAGGGSADLPTNPTPPRTPEGDAIQRN